MSLRLIGSVAPALPADLMARIVHAEQMAAKAEADALAADGRAEAARVEAAKAEATGQNARDMVLRRDERIADAQNAADAAAAKADAIDVKRSEYEAALAASIADRAALRSTLATLTSQGAADRIALAALQSTVAGLQALKVMVGFGTATLTGSLLAGASRDVTVPLSRDMGSTVYSCGSSLSGGTSLLGQLVHDGIVTQTRTSVTVRVRNTGVAAIANLSAAVVYVVSAREA